MDDELHNASSTFGFFGGGAPLAEARKTGAACFAGVPLAVGFITLVSSAADPPLADGFMTLGTSSAVSLLGALFADGFITPGSFFGSDGSVLCADEPLGLSNPGVADSADFGADGFSKSHMLSLSVLAAGFAVATFGA